VDKLYVTKVLRWVILLVAATGAFSSVAGELLEDRQIVALVSQDSSLSASQIVVAMSGSNKNSPLRQALGNPLNCELLQDVAFLPTANTDDDYPSNVSLRYLVLTYSSSTSASSALSVVSGNAMIDIAYLNSRLSYSSTITDELVSDPAPADPLNTNFLWHTQLMNMTGLQDAWSFGSGWLGFGIFDGAPDLSQPDLQGSYNKLGSWHYDVGVSQPQGRRDVIYDPLNAGVHGTLTTALVAGRANNPRPGESIGQGTVGMCPGCRLMIQAGVLTTSITKGLDQLARWGASVVSFSGGLGSGADPVTRELIDPIGTPCALGNVANQHASCPPLKLLAQRDVMFFAAAGNFDSIREENAGSVINGHYGVQWPARDPNLAYAVGGVHVSTSATGARWTESFWPSEPWDVAGGKCPGIGYNGTSLTTRKECGSNYGPELDFAAPARDVVSIVAPGASLAPGWCEDAALGTSNDGVAYCRGTSFSTPIVAGGAALLRSLNPLVHGQGVAQLMMETSKQAVAGVPVFDPELGYGIPDFGAAARRIMGKSNGAQVTNRLTPVFLLGNEVQKDFLYTASPQVATAAVAGDLYRSRTSPAGVGQARFYDQSPERVFPYVFPDTRSPLFSGFSVSIFPESGRYIDPGSYFHSFTGDRPVLGTPLKPLYRLALPDNICDLSNSAYATAMTGLGSVEYFTQVVGNNPKNFCGTPVKAHAYSIEGIEGYVFQNCPVGFGACNDFSDLSKPQGLYLKYSNSASGQRFALLLGSQMSWAKYSTYTQTVDGADGLIGYVFPNWDSDADGLIDGFERLLGTDRFNTDSDCDGMPDGEEFPLASVQETGKDPMLGGSCGPRLTANVTWTTTINSQGGKIATYTVNVTNPASLPSQANVSVVFLHGGKRVAGALLPSTCSDWVPDPNTPPDAPPYHPETEICSIGQVASGTTNTTVLSWEVAAVDDAERASVKVVLVP
jgi:hypothetical protein